VERALAGYGAQARRADAGPRPADLADALVSLERSRREARKERRQGTTPASGGDLWTAGLDLVWDWLARR
jgi:hypothetical protein